MDLPLALPGPDRWRHAYDPRALGIPLHEVLERMDPAFEHAFPMLAPEASREEVERLVCQAARSEETSAADLARIAENAVYATSTRVADCLLEDPRAREAPEVLRILAGMTDVNHDPRLPGRGAPAISEVRSRAEALLRGMAEP